MADTRKDKRAPVSLKVRFKSATVDEFIEHYSKDVSRGGIFIKSSQPMPVGTLLKFQFQLKDESALIRGVGRVVWTRAEEDAGDDQPAGMGIKFIKMENDSRAMVERIVDSHEADQGTYERGRHGATASLPTSSAPPPSASEPGFFPELPPAELPALEDRTAVRQAAQFLASALAEGGTDEAAAREAQQGAEEAQKRTEEIEAQRRKEAEQRKRKEPAPAEPLPSMIIDPSLESSVGTEAERVPESDSPRPSLSVASARATLGDDEEREEPDTEPPPPPQQQTATTSIPQQTAPRSRPNYLPIAVIAGVLAIAAGVALRGGPKELPVEQLSEHDEPAPVEPPATIAPIPKEPPHAEPVPAEPEPEPSAASDAGTPVAATVARVEVTSVPRGAQVFVGDEARGTAPLTLELAEGAPVTVRARATGYAEASAELTPKAKNDPLRLKLKALPYFVHVETTPPGAAVNVAGHKGTTPVDLRLDEVPVGELSVNARLPGHELARARLAPSAFAESDGAMRATLALTLEPSADASAPGAPAKPNKERARKAPAEAPSAPAASPESTPAPASEPAKPPSSDADAPAAGTPAPAAGTPAPADAPAQPLPDNPFGKGE